MVNPFRVPGLANQRAPLCPWRNLDHLNQYVAYESVRMAMACFAEYLRGWHDGRGPGRLIVVTGDSHCGKTSLANWCAFHLDRVTNGAIGRLPGTFVLDLSGYRYLPVRSDEVGTTARAAQVCAGAIATLRANRQVAVPDAWLSGSNQAEDRYREIYKELAERAAALRFTPIVIIPSISNFVNDVDEYFYLAATHANIVFIAESSDDAIIDRVRRERDEHDQVAWLQLWPMSEVDGWLFVTELLKQCGMVPGTRIAENDVIGLMRHLKYINANSPLKLRSVLYSAWESHENELPPGAVTSDDLLGHLRPRPPADAAVEEVAI